MWPLSAQSPENKILLDPQAFEVGISDEARLLQNLLKNTTTQLLSV